MSSSKITFLAYILIWFLPLAAFSQRSYQTNRLNGPAPQIDGIINDPAWESVAWGDSFTQREPYDGKSPSQQTAFRILYDDKFVYVAVRAFDSVPSEIVTRLTRRDNTDADWVGIIFDSYNDNLTGFGFAVTASGVKMDLMIINDGQDDVSWDAIWNAKSHIDEKGWTAEFSIPLSQLRFSGKDEMTWGLNVLRYIYRKEEMSVWQPIARNAPGFVSLFGDLQGLRGIKPKREVEILPYMVAKAQYDEKEEGNPFATGKSYGFNAGVDGKVALTNDFTLNFTVNPDFGQVEADPSEVNLTAFESYFEEKRPFFIEGKNIFDFRLTGGDGDGSQNTMFYSRRIGREPHYYPETADGEYMKMPSTSHILGSFKVSGKSRNGLSVGILESLTAVEKAKFDLAGATREMTVEPFTNYFVARVKQDFNKGVSSLGGIITTTNRSISVDYLKDLPTAAYTGGLDYTHTWKEKTYYYNVKLLGTRLSGDTRAIAALQESSAHYYQSPDKNFVEVDTTATSLSGMAGTFEIGKQGNGHFNFMTWVTMRSPGVDFNDIGFMRQADEIQHVFWIGYRKYEPVAIFKSFGLNFNEYQGFDFGGRNIYKGVNMNGFCQFKNYWFFNTGMNLDGESLDRSQLRGGPALLTPGGVSTWFGVSTDSRKKLNLEASGNMYFGFDNYFRTNGFSIGGTYKPLNSLSVSVYPDYSFGFNELQYVAEKEFEGEPRYVLAMLDQQSLGLSMRLNYTITPDLTVQFYGQPFLFAGKYSGYKVVNDPMASDYEGRIRNLTAGEDLTQNEDGVWEVDENHDGISDYSFENENFNFLQFRSNLVVRWEYRPGSSLYLVWSQGRTENTSYGDFGLHRDLRDLFEKVPQDVFLLKVSYMLVF